MIDTSAQINLIKRKAFEPDAKINTKFIYQSTGIIDGKVYTQEECTISIKTVPSEFHIVSDTFPIDTILGNAFFKETPADVLYSKACIAFKNYTILFATRDRISIPPRSKSIIHIRVKNNEINEGYIPKMNLQTNVLIGNALVKHNGGIAYLCVIKKKILLSILTSQQ